MRREWKRVNGPIGTRKQLLNQIQSARVKFKDAGLPRGFGGLRNVALVDFGAQLDAGGMSETYALREIQEFLEGDLIAKQFLDELIIRIKGVDPPPMVP